MSLEHSPVRQKRRGRSQQARGPPDAIDAMSIREFCRRNNLSEPFYYKLQKQGLGPDVIKIGKRTLISTKAGDRWREANERKAAAATS
jgi:hypothetical protein